MQFHAELEGVGWLAIAADPHVAGGDAFDGALRVIQNFGRWKTRKNFYAKFFGLLAEPAHNIGQRDDVVAMVLKAAWQ